MFKLSSYQVFWLSGLQIVNVEKVTVWMLGLDVGEVEASNNPCVGYSSKPVVTEKNCEIW